MSSNNYFYINSDYGYNKKDFRLIENFENINVKNTNINSKNIYYNKKLNNQLIQVNKNNQLNQKFTKLTNKEEPVNTFPLAWTCYKSNDKWICPMRGDIK
tara:strand:+ start:1021 stop:1320 length:300 start_codon:yes stop_codon:yes gene_type:complete